MNFRFGFSEIEKTGKASGKADVIQTLFWSRPNSQTPNDMYFTIFK